MSLEAGWESAEKFILHLNDIIARETEAIRETELEAGAESILGALVKVAGKREPIATDVKKDRLGRIHLPVGFYRKKITHINIGPVTGQMVQVLKTEERWTDEKPSSVVCYLEG